MKSVLAAAAVAAAVFISAVQAATVTFGALPGTATANLTPTLIGTFGGGPTPAGTPA